MSSHATSLNRDVKSEVSSPTRTSKAATGRPVRTPGSGAGAGVVTKTLVVVPAIEGHISVSDAGTAMAALSVQWGDVLMRFTSAAQVTEVLAAFGAVREAMRGVDGALVTAAGDGRPWPWVSVVSVAWMQPPGWSVVSQSKYDAAQRRTIYWVDVYMGPVQWRFVDWAGYEAAMTLMRNAHRAAVAVFDDGAQFSTDPSRMDAFAAAGIPDMHARAVTGT